MSNTDPTAPDYGANVDPVFPQEPGPATPYPPASSSDSGMPAYPQAAAAPPPSVPPPPPSGGSSGFPPPPSGGSSGYSTPPSGGSSGYSAPPAYGTPSDSGAAFPPPAYPPSGQPYGAPPMAPGSAYGAPGAVALPGGGTPPTMVTRLLARIIDAVLLGIVFSILGAVGLGGASMFSGSDTASSFAFGAWLSMLALFAVLSLAYEVVLIALRGATLGKQLMGIKVVQVDSGALPGWGPSLIRWGLPTVASFICSILSLVVYLSPFWADPTGRMRGYHDQAAKTVVVPAR